MIDSADIHRLPMGYVIAPPGGPVPAGQPVMLCAYLVRHPRGTLLWDTGIGEHPEVEELFRPVRRGLEDALRGHGLRLADVDVVGNCHLHFDHAGGNARFPDVPILAQRVEHQAAARVEDYTIPGIADFPGARYELLAGDAVVWDGIRVVPTPGHTDGHQSLVLDTRQGRVVLAGQSFNTASDYARARLVREAGIAGSPLEAGSPVDAGSPLEAGNPAEAGSPVEAGHPVEAGYPAWMDIVEALDPWRVYFAHDTAVVESPVARP